MRGIAVLLCLLMLLSCDTSRNTPDPTDHYFIRYYGTDGNQESVDMLPNDDGTYMLLGTSKISAESPGQVYLVKVNNDGFVLWERTYGGANDEIAKDIEKSTNGNYVILADVKNAGSGTDILLITINENGDQLKSGSFSYSGVSNEIGISVTPVMDDALAAGFIVAGHTNFDSVGFFNETALHIRFDQNCKPLGNIWKKFQGGGSNDFAVKVVQNGTDLSDPNVFSVFGYTNSDPINTTYNFWATRVDQYGEGASLSILEGSPSGTNNEKLGAVTSSSSINTQGYLLSGISSTGSGADKIFLAKLISGSLVEDGILTPQSLDVNLGDVSSRSFSYQKVTSWPTALGYLVAANTVNGGNSNILLTKIGVDGELIWDAPVILGGSGEDYESAVYEQADGRIIIFGTMEIGDDKQKKMTLIKLNENGDFK